MGRPPSPARPARSHSRPDARTVQGAEGPEPPGRPALPRRDRPVRTWRCREVLRMTLAAPGGRHGPVDPVLRRLRPRRRRAAGGPVHARQRLLRNPGGRAGVVRRRGRTIPAPTSRAATTGCLAESPGGGSTTTTWSTCRTGFRWPSAPQAANGSTLTAREASSPPSATRPAPGGADPLYGCATRRGGHPGRPAPPGLHGRPPPGRAGDHDRRGGLERPLRSCPRWTDASSTRASTVPGPPGST